MRRVLIQCHKINFESVAFETKLRTRSNNTQPESPVYNMLKPGSGMLGVDFGTLVKGVISATVA